MWCHYKWWLLAWSVSGLAPVREGSLDLRGSTMYTRLVRPDLLSKDQAPVLVVHGGPGVPSDYLWPLTECVPFRTLVFFDQLGCGRSGPATEYSIEKSVDDMQTLTRHLGLTRFHLYGQSFGGLLAHAYARRNAASSAPQEILSLALSSAPSDVCEVEKTAQQLVEQLGQVEDVSDAFRVKHQCRVPTMPKPLSDAYARAADPAAGWRGSQAIRSYIAPPLNGLKLPSALVTRGEHDFVTDDCLGAWPAALSTLRKRTFSGCSHHGLLEDPGQYAAAFEAFWCEYDE